MRRGVNNSNPDAIKAGRVTTTGTPTERLTKNISWPIMQIIRNPDFKVAVADEH
jgi:hypothetical protein